MSSYALLLRPGWEGVIIDTFFDVSDAIVKDVSFKQWMTAAKVADRMNGGDNAVKDNVTLLKAVNFMDFRSRYDQLCEGPYLLHCDREFKRDELEDYLRDNPEVVRRLREGGRI